MEDITNTQHTRDQQRHGSQGKGNARETQGEPIQRRSSQQQSAQGLDGGQIRALFDNCLKLASENKITAKNTWDLPLIDHLSDLVQASRGAGELTNFQRASVTLDASVKIYGSRVDSVHTIAFQTLSGLSRSSAAAQEGEDSAAGQDEGEGAGVDPTVRRPGREPKHSTSPAATLEASFEALNVKKFDLTFAMDPLFRRTSAQFDEGGAKGLLLNNLSVIRGLELMFDSLDIPDQATETLQGTAERCLVDIGDLLPLAQAALQGASAAVLTPSLPELAVRLEQPPLAASSAAYYDSFVAGIAEGTPVAPMADSQAWPQPATQEDVVDDEGHAPMEIGGDDGYEGPPGFQDDGSDADNGYQADFGEQEEDVDVVTVQDALLTQAPDEPSMGMAHSEQQAKLSEAAVQHLLGNSAGSGMAWAGAAHWRYRTRAAARPAAAEGGEAGAEAPAAKPATRGRQKSMLVDFCALGAVPQERLRQAAPAAICLKGAPTKADTLLPEDHHYQASQLMQLFLKPNAGLLHGHASASAPAADEQSGMAGGDWGDAGDGFGGDDDCDDDGMCGHDSSWNDALGWGDESAGVESAEGLLAAPRKVERIAISYAQASKQVDVRALKQALWRSLQEVRAQSADDAELDFQEVIGRALCGASPELLRDLSVHVCFICLLHLANENSLRISSVPSLDRLTAGNMTLTAS